MTTFQRPVFFEQFEFQAQLHAARVAVQGPSEALSYAELSAESNRIATALRRAGVQPGRGAVVALRLEPGPAYVAALLGVSKAGAVFMPLPSDLPLGRARAVMARAACSVVITDACEPLPDGLASESLRVLQRHDWDALDGRSAPAVTIGPTDPCYVIYTSGSTGEPKAILGSHRGLSHFLRWELAELGLDPTVRGSWLAPVTFDVSLRDMLVPLMAGGTVLHPGEHLRTQPLQLLQWMATRGITLVHCVPTVLRLFNRALQDGTVALPDLRHLLVAGEPLLACDVAAWRQRSGVTAEVLNLYGPSETTLAKLFHRVGDVTEDDRSVLPVGRPLPNTAVLILQDDRVCAPGDIGEICIATPYRSLGYLHQPELTRSVFVPNPLTGQAGDIIYRTGDLGRILPDGSVLCMGRQDGQVKVNGVRIELAEIEAVLQRMPGVAQCACALHPLSSGQSALLVAYYCRPQPEDAALDVQALNAHLREYLPEAMLPHRFMRVASIPTTVSGKVNRKALPKPGEVYYGEDGFVAASSPTELTLARIWGELLDVEAVGVTTPFQHLGGDSLRAIRALMRIFQECRVEVSLKDFYRLPTVRALAGFIDGQSQLGAPVSPIPRLPLAEVYPVSPAQERLWRLQQMGIAPTAYNLQTTYELRGPLDPGCLEDALQLVALRHESLRTVFSESGGRAFQRVLERVPALMQVLDMRHESQADQRAAERVMHDEQLAFDLERGPLMRLTLLRMPVPEHAPPQARHLLIFNVHHIISDVWSLSVLARDLSHAYAARCRGALPDWQPPSVQMKDAVGWQNSRLEGGLLETDRQYWLAEFATPPAPLLLPADRPRPPAQTFVGGTRRRRLSAQSSHALRELAQAQGCTLFAVIQALVKVLLHRYSGQTDIVVGTPVAGREHVDLREQIGYYVNVLPLRDSVQGEWAFDEFLARSAARARTALSHQSWPFDRLVAELDLPRDMSRSPLFDVMVVVDTFDEVTLALEGLHVTPWGRDNAWNFSRFDLVFHFQTEGDELVLDLNYNSDLFDAQRIDRACGHFEALADAAAQAPQRPVGDLALCLTHERAQLIEWSQGAPIDRAPASISARFAATASAFPQRTAVFAAGQSWSYAQLLAASDALAGALQSDAQWAPGTSVAVWANRTRPGLVALLGIMRAGGVYLPLDPAYPPARVQRILAVSGCRWMVADDESHACAARAVVGDACRVDTVEAFLQAGRSVGPALPAPDAAAYMIFTSGSTGQPKGVVCRHGAFVNMSLGQIECLGLVPQDRVMQFASPAFDASLANLFMALFCGAAVVLPTSKALESADAFLEELASTGSTVVTLAPSFLRAIDRRPMTGLRVLITAGEPAVAEDLAHYALRHDVFNAYGPTEGTVCTTMHRVPRQQAGHGRVPIGKPLPNLQVRVVDARGQMLPVGIPGTLLIGGQGLAIGYHGDAELTARRFREVAAVPVMATAGQMQRFYESGDRVCWLDSGELDFIGRDDDQVKVSGHRIELGDVEHALRDCPDVADAAVVAVKRHDGATALAAYFCAARRLELWPSVAEFYVYDDVVYNSMAQDEGRNDRYRAAFARHLKGKIVVDIGTGPFAILSRLAVEAGAAHVYAVDLLEATADRARQAVQRLGLSDRITVLHGDARTVQLPQAADVCISEIVGAIGGSEGAALIINGARRLLRDPSAMLPKRSVTRLAAVHLPTDSLDWAFPDVAAHYVERIFEQVGKPFDLRLCVKHLPRGAIVSSAGVLEDLDYTQMVEPAAIHTERLSVLRDGPVNGLLAWLQLHVDDDQVVDILDNPASWLPVFVPLDVAELPACQGDELVLTVHRSLAHNGLNPDFRIQGSLQRRGAEVMRFRADSLHFGAGFRNTDFHARLFAADGQVPRSARGTAQQVRAELARRLPGYAVPAYIVALDRLPTTVHGKVDRQALPNPASAPAAQDDTRSGKSELEALIAQVWRAVLGRETIGRNDDFFVLGGDSIRAIQIVSRLRRIGIRAEVQDLFQNPDIASLARSVEVSGVVAVQHAVDGALELSPIQHWLLRSAGRDPRRFHQAVGVWSKARLDRSAVQSALQSLWKHHDGLRLVLADTTDAPPTASIATATGAAASWPVAPAFFVLDAVGRDDFEPLLEQAAESLYSAIDLAPGRALFGALHARGDRGDLVILAAHHFVVDRVSWDILLEDFEAALQSVQAGNEVLLPLKSHSLIDWSRYLQCLHQQADLAAVENFMAEAAAVEPPPWAREESFLSREMVTHTIRLPGEAVEPLLARHPQGGASLEDLLLASVAVALRRSAGLGKVLVDIESHGRSVPQRFEQLARRPDISRTVGWFTTFVPLILDPAEAASMTEMAAVVHARRQSLPDQGWSYLLLLERLRVAQAGAALRRGQATVGFNFLGALGDATGSGMFEIDWSPPGRTTGDETGSPHALDILACVINGSIEVSLTAAASARGLPSLEALGDEIVRSLRQAASERSQQGPNLEAFSYQISANDLEAMLGSD